MCRLAIAVIRCAGERGQPLEFTRMDGRTNHLIFRAFSVENGKEELTVSVLAFRELEGGKDLSERWGCGLDAIISTRDTHTKGDVRTWSSILQEESISCWGWWTVWLMALGREGERGGRMVREEEGGGWRFKYGKGEIPSISTPRVGKECWREKPKPSSVLGMGEKVRRAPSKSGHSF